MQPISLSDIASWLLTKWHPDKDPKNPVLNIEYNSVETHQRPKPMAPNSSQQGERSTGSRNLKDMLGNNQTNSSQNPSRNTTSTPPPTATTNRRAPPKLTTKDIIALNNEVKDAVSGQKYLERTALAITGKPYTTDCIAEILLHITQLPGIPLPAITATRAIAFILEDLATNETAEAVAKLVITAISPQIAKLHDTEQVLSKISTESVTNGVTQEAQLQNIQNSLNSITSQLANPTPAKPSYANVVNNSPQLPNSEQSSQRTQILAREAIKDRQIRIDYPANSQLAAGNSSHEQLVSRVQKALKALPNSDETNITLESKAVTQFKTGGMIVEMTSKEAADYIRKNEAIKDLFLTNLDKNATLKERTYTLLIPFMPLTFNPSDRPSLDALENENDMNPNSIVLARWIKPVDKRKPTQRVAHALLTFDNAATANKAIKDGLTLNQLKLWPKKNRQEPMRCAKCQHYGHIARECISHKDTCANCGNDHRSSDCTDQDKHHCTSCESDDHPSWSRDCPAFNKECEKLDKRYPDNLLPFFPTSEEWTYAHNHVKPPPYRKAAPPETSHAQPPGTQRTLNEFTTRNYNNSRRGGPPHRNGLGRGFSPDSPQNHHYSQTPPPLRPSTTQSSLSEDLLNTSGWDV